MVYGQFFPPPCPFASLQKHYARAEFFVFVIRVHLFLCIVASAYNMYFHSTLNPPAPHTSTLYVFTAVSVSLRKMAFISLLPAPLLSFFNKLSRSAVWTFSLLVWVQTQVVCVCARLSPYFTLMLLFIFLPL